MIPWWYWYVLIHKLLQVSQHEESRNQEKLGTYLLVWVHHVALEVLYSQPDALWLVFAVSLCKVLHLYHFAPQKWINSNNHDKTLLVIYIYNISIILDIMFVSFGDTFSRLSTLEKAGILSQVESCLAEMIETHGSTFGYFWISADSEEFFKSLQVFQSVLLNFVEYEPWGASNAHLIDSPQAPLSVPVEPQTSERCSPQPESMTIFLLLYCIVKSHRLQTFHNFPSFEPDYFFRYFWLCLKDMRDFCET